MPSVSAGRALLLAYAPQRAFNSMTGRNRPPPSMTRRIFSCRDVPGGSVPYYGLAVESMRRSGRRIDDEVLAHISPAHSENINFFGSIDVDIEGELAQLGPTGYRPLRVRDTLF